MACAGELTDPGHFFVGLFVDRDSVSKNSATGLPFFFSVGVDPLLTLCLGRVPKLLQEPGEGSFQILLLAKDTVVQGHEEMTDIGSAGGLVDIIGGGAAGENGGADLTEHGKTIALVAAGEVSGSAQGQNTAAGLVDDIRKDFGGIGTGMTGLIHGPALGDYTIPLGIDFQFASGHHGSSGIKGKGYRRGRHGEGNGIGAQHRLSTEGRDQDRLAVGHTDADQAFPGGHTGIVAGNAEMVGIPHRNHTNPRSSGLLNGKLHCLDAQKLTHGVVTFDGSGNGSLFYDLGFGMDIHEAVGDLLVITDQPLDTVGLDTAKIRIQKHIGNALALLGTEAVTCKDTFAECGGFFIGQVYITHRGASLQVQ